MLQNDSAEIPLNFNTDTPQVIADLISKCLVRRPDERPPFDKIEDLFMSVDGDKLKVTLKSQKIKIKSFPQNSSVTNTQNLKTILDGIKTIIVIIVQFQRKKLKSFKEKFLILN